MTSNILTPAAVLVAWSMVMVIWMFVTRFYGFARAGIDLTKAEPGARYVDVADQMPARINWKSHNYTHLMEQPTVFYAAVFIIALSGGGSTAAVGWAWAYTGFRVAHSLWQALVNLVPVRFLLFLGSNVCLLVLTWYALRLTL